MSLWRKKGGGQMIYLSVIIIGLYVLLFLVSRNYNKKVIEKLNEKEHPLKVFYSIGFFLYDFIYLKIVSKISSKAGLKGRRGIREDLKTLFVLDSYEYQEKLYTCKKTILSLLVFFFVNFIIIVSGISQNLNSILVEEKYIKRPSVLEEDKSADMEVYIKDENRTIKEEIKLVIEGRKYTREEFDEIIERELEKLDSYILNKNISFNKITGNLNFISNLPGTPIGIEWISGDLSIISREGVVQNNGLKEGRIIEIKAVFSYDEFQSEYLQSAYVESKVYTKEEQIKEKLNDFINAVMKKTKHDKIIELPGTLEEYQLSWKIKEESTHQLLFIAGVFIAILFYPLMDKDLKKKVEERNKQLLLDYPELVYKFTLYLGVGMSLSGAWERVVKDFSDKGGYLYYEMLLTYKELMVGTTEAVAYEGFGRRIKLVPYLRFSTYLAQNTTKGNRIMLQQLELEAANAFAERKEIAKRLGEEAGTKLILPMIIMLVLVLMIIIVPAFTSIAV